MSSSTAFHTDTMAAAAQRTVVVAFDIEKAGALSRHPVVAVGAVAGVLGDVGGDKKLWCLDVGQWAPEREGGVFEDRCWDEFWSKDFMREPSKLFHKQAKPAAAVWREICEWVNALETRYPEDQFKLKFATDNGPYDIPAIDRALEQYCGRLPLAYSTKGRYRSTCAADDMLSMLSPELQAQAKAEISQRVQHDHNPANDAHVIYLQYEFAARHQPKKSH